MIFIKAIKIVFICVSTLFMFAVASFAVDLPPAVRAVGDYTVVVTPLHWYTTNGTTCTFTCSVEPEATDYTYYWNGRYSSDDVFRSISSDHISNTITIEYDPDHPYLEIQCSVYKGTSYRVIGNIVYFEYNGLPSPSPEPNPGPTVDPVNPIPSPTPIPVPTPYPSYNPVPSDPTYGYWDFIKNFFSDIFNFITPWGIAFGAVVVGIFGLPLLVKAIKKFF